jgi:hypothetical protein
MTRARIAIRPVADIQPIACQFCGRPSLRVADMINTDNNTVGRTLVCTNCWGSHHKGGD